MPAPLLHDRFPALRATLPHVALGEGPTPVRRLRAIDGAEAWLKEDGRYGGPYGGNKVRKLEWVLADAQRRGSRTILTIGALATNHGLATAIYARRLGLATALVLVDQPVDEHVRAQLARLRASGAALHVTHSRTRTVAADALALDPVYAAKAMAGLLALARRGELAGGPVLFLATGDALSG
jgi:D-cysteine desulfhydrase